MEENQQPDSQLPEQPIEPVSSEPHMGPPAKRPMKKWLLVSIVAVLLLGGGVYAWYSQSHKKPATTAKSSSSTSPSTQASTKVMAESVVYYTHDKAADPYTIYTRSAAGGERKAILTLNTKFETSYYVIDHSDLYGQTAVFSTNDGIYVSQDGAKTFKNVYKLDPAKAKDNQAVTSLRLSIDGKKVVFALLPEMSSGAPNNTVKVMDLDGKNSADVHAFANTAGVFVYSYDATKQQLVYATGCYFCDGAPGVPHLMDIKANSDKTLATIDTKTQVLNTVVASRDGQKIIYSVGVNDQQLAEAVGGIGWQGGPPYKVMQVDVSTGQSTQLATVGTLHEKDTDGKFKLYYMLVGFTADKSVPFYTADTKLFTVSGAQPSLSFEATKKIWNAAYVSADDIFTNVDSSANGNGDYTLYHYDTATQKTTAIFQGDASTTVMGVTRK